MIDIETLSTIACILIGLVLLSLSKSLSTMENNNATFDPIYVALETEDYAKAAKICLKPQLCHYPLTKALLAYSYCMLGRPQDGLDVARRVAESKPIDDNILATLAHTFRKCKKEDELLICYENALAAQTDPRKYNQIAMDVFFIYNKMGDFKKMQFLSQKLFKASSKPLFLFWSVCSMLQQNDLPPQMLLVAEKTIAKIFEGSPDMQPGAEELELYVHIISKQGRHGDALKALDELSSRPQGPLIIDNDDFEINGSMVKVHSLRLASLRAELLSEIADAKPLLLGGQIKTIIGMYPDQWSAHQQLITDVVFAASNDDIESEVISHQQYLLAIQASHSKLRGPYLAELLLLQKWLDGQGAGGGQRRTRPSGWSLCSADSSTYAPSTAMAGDAQLKCADECCKLLARYASIFRAKQCCFSDIKSYMESMSRVFPAEFLEPLRAWLMVEAASLAESVLSISTTTNTTSGPPADNSDTRDSMIDLICSYCKLSQITFSLSYMGSDGGVKHAEDIVGGRASSIKLFLAAKSLCGYGVGGEKEVQPCDEILSLCSSAYRILYMRSASAESELNLASDGVWSRAAVAASWAQLLLYAMEQSPYNYSFKLDVLEPLRELGIVDSALVAFNGMGIKSVQFDSLSFLILPSLMEMGLFSEAAKLHRSVLTFHVSASRDTADQMSKCYKHNNFMKVLELKKFIERCSKSFQFAISKVELPLLELLEKHHDIDSTKAATRDFIAEAADGTVFSPFCFRESDVDLLIDNSDYNLLVRPDSSSSVDYVEVSTRREGYKQRILRGQYVLRSVAHCVTKDYTKSLHYIGRLRSTSSPTASSSGYLPWDQRFICGDSEFNSSIHECIHTVLAFAVSSAAALQKMTASNPAVVDIDITDLQSEGAKAIDLLANMRSALLGDDLKRLEEQMLSILGQRGDDHSSPPAPLHVTWLRRVGLFVEASACCVPVVLLCAISLCPKSVKGGGKKGGKGSGKGPAKVAVNDDKLSLAAEQLRSAAYAYSKLGEELAKLLERRLPDIDGFGAGSCPTFFEKAAERVSKTSAGSKAAVLREQRRALGQQLSSSQATSCARYAAVLRAKAEVLREAL